MLKITTIVMAKMNHTQSILSKFSENCCTAGQPNASCKQQRKMKAMLNIFVFLGIPFR